MVPQAPGTDTDLTAVAAGSAGQVGVPFEFGFAQQTFAPVIDVSRSAR